MMKKWRFFNIPIALCIIVLIVGCGMMEANLSEETNNIIPIQSLGNQLNAQLFPREFNKNEESYLRGFFKDKEWIYAINENFSDKNSIVKFQIGNPSIKETIYESDLSVNQVATYGDYIYYILQSSLESENFVSDLYRIHKDGSGQKKMKSEVSNFMLTDEKIFFTTYKTNGYSSIYTVNLDGSQEQLELGKYNSLIGLDKEWIYYNRDNGEEVTGPNRARFDKLQNKTKLHSEINVYDSFVAENKQIFYAKTTNEKLESDKYKNIVSIIKKDDKDNEVCLTEIQMEEPEDIIFNIEKDFLFFSNGKELYRININGKEKEHLVYRAEDEIWSIFLFDGDILLSTFSENLYIKKDGTIQKISD